MTYTFPVGATVRTSRNTYLVERQVPINYWAGRALPAPRPGYVVRPVHNGQPVGAGKLVPECALRAAA